MEGISELLMKQASFSIKRKCSGIFVLLQSLYLWTVIGLVKPNILCIEENKTNRQSNEDWLVITDNNW